MRDLDYGRTDTRTADLSTALRSPGFPVELGGVGALYAAFLNESSTRGNLQCRVAGNPTPVEMTNLLSHSRPFHGLDALPFPCSQFVISTGAYPGLWPIQGDEKRLGPATTLYRTIAVSFVIPSEAEGSAVPRTFRGSVESSLHTDLSSRPERTRSGEICGFLLDPH